MPQLINRINFNSFSQCLHSLQSVNIFQLFDHGGDTGGVTALNNAKKRIMTIVHLAQKAYLPLSAKPMLFSDAELANVIDNYYIQLGDFQETKDGIKVVANQRKAIYWGGLPQFIDFLKWLLDVIKYVGNSPIPSIKKLSQTSMTATSIAQMITVFKLIQSHYHNVATTVTDKQAKVILQNVFSNY